MGVPGTRHHLFAETEAGWREERRMSEDSGPKGHDGCA